MELGSQGCSYNEDGIICLSRLRGNAVISNIVGAAAYWGNNDILKFIIKKSSLEKINLTATEVVDNMINNKKQASFVEEYQGLTPLQLAIVSPHAD